MLQSVTSKCYNVTVNVTVNKESVTLMKCPVCNTNELEGRQKICSGACRVRLSRQKDKTPELVKAEQEATKDAANMSQEEIEAYYTKDNFPSLTYGASSPNPPHMRQSRG